MDAAGVVAVAAVVVEAAVATNCRNTAGRSDSMTWQSRDWWYSYSLPEFWSVYVNDAAESV
jgi:hypothetical protein